MFSIVFYHANACTSMRLLVEIDNGPDSAVWASLYKYREGYMDIPDGIDRQAKTLTRGSGYISICYLRGEGSQSWM